MGRGATRCPGKTLQAGRMGQQPQPAEAVPSTGLILNSLDTSNIRIKIAAPEELVKIK